MQQGFMICAVLLGASHIKWAAKEGRAAGEMVTLYLCPQAVDGGMGERPCEVMVQHEDIPSVNAKLQTLKQFDTVMINLDKQRDRLVYRGFFEFPKK